MNELASLNVIPDWTQKQLECIPFNCADMQQWPKVLTETIEKLEVKHIVKLRACFDCLEEFIEIVVSNAKSLKLIVQNLHCLLQITPFSIGILAELPWILRRTLAEDNVLEDLALSNTTADARWGGGWLILRRGLWWWLSWRYCLGIFAC